MEEYVKMNELQRIDRDVARELRINNLIGLMNESRLSQMNSNIIGTANYLSYQIGETSTSFSKALSSQTRTICEEISSVNKILRNLQANIVCIGEIVIQQTTLMEKTLEILDEMHDTLKHPMETQSKENFERGLQWIKKGFLSEAAEAFKISIEQNPTNYLSHLYLGILYLCGKDDDDNVIDFSKAEIELSLAIKYSKPDIEDSYSRQYIISIHQYLSDLYYALALSGKDPDQNYEKAYKELKTALDIDSSEETTDCLCLRLIKCANKVKDKEGVVEYAKYGFVHDSSLIILLEDEDFISYRDSFIKIIDDSRLILKDKISSLLTDEKAFDSDRMKKIVEMTHQSSFDSYLGLASIFELLLRADVRECQIENKNNETKSSGKYSICLSNFDHRKIAVIKTVREFNPAFSLSEAKDIVDNAIEGEPLFQHLSKEQATKYEDIFNETFAYDGVEIEIIEEKNTKFDVDKMKTTESLGVLLMEYDILSKINDAFDPSIEIKKEEIILFMQSHNIREIAKCLDNKEVQKLFKGSKDQSLIKVLDDIVISELKSFWSDINKKVNSEYDALDSQSWVSIEPRKVLEKVDYETRDYVLPSGKKISSRDYGYKIFYEDIVEKIDSIKTDKKKAEDESIAKHAEAEKAASDARKTKSFIIRLIIFICLIIFIIQAYKDYPSKYIIGAIFWIVLFFVLCWSGFIKKWKNNRF